MIAVVVDEPVSTEWLKAFFSPRLRCRDERFFMKVQIGKPRGSQLAVTLGVMDRSDG